MNCEAAVTAVVYIDNMGCALRVLREFHNAHREDCQTVQSVVRLVMEMNPLSRSEMQVDRDGTVSWWLWPSRAAPACGRPAVNSSPPRFPTPKRSLHRHGVDSRQPHVAYDGGVDRAGKFSHWTQGRTKITRTTNTEYIRAQKYRPQDADFERTRHRRQMEAFLTVDYKRQK